MDENDLPYMVEYAKSNRSSCKKCKNNIGKDVLRVGVMVQSPHFDGKVPNWHHVACFFSKWVLKSTDEIKHYSTLRYEDQKMLQSKVGVAASGAGSSKSKKGSKKANVVDTDVIDFSIEYAKSSRAACKVCDEKIQKQEIRISKLDKESDKAKRFGPLPAWHHVDCFVKVKGSLGFTKAGDSLPGFSSLSKEDKEVIKEKIKGITDKKRKLDEETEAVPAKIAKPNGTEKKEELALKNQSKLIYSFRDKLQKNFARKQLAELLELNDQTPPTGESLQLDMLADGLSFGALKPCPECSGQLKIGSYDYKCTGNLTSWTKCQYHTLKPDRKKFLVTEDYIEEFPFLKSYKYVKRDRIFPPKPEMPSSSSGGNPLDNFKIAFIGDLKRGNAEAEKLILTLGGKVVKRVDKSLTCIISNKEESEKNSAKIKAAEKKDIFIVNEEFLDEVKNGGAALLIKKHLLYPWGGDPVEKLCSMTTKFSKSVAVSSAFSSKSKIQKVSVQGKAAVDPDSGLEDDAVVLEHENSPLNAVLGMVDIQRGTNSYYKLQVLEQRKKYFVFRSWGRVGTTIGGNKLDKFSTAADAIANFKEVYLEKTSNEWEDRNRFMKYPNRFYPLDIDYGQEAAEQMPELKIGSTSKLPMPVQKLICLIFDVEAMKKAMLEFEIDLEKMPLGKLSKKQIQSAYSILTELQKILEGDKNDNKILDASNRFYTLIPHDFGMKKPTMLNNLDLLKSKTEMLDSLLEMEIAYSLLKVDMSKVADPIDQHYLQLKTKIEVLEEYTKEFQFILKYLDNTHAETHNQYRLDIEQVFKVHREGEQDRYHRKFKDLHNKKLLWHGSRVTNFVGILSQGLRIAPPEAPVTGYMFGKGIYFADMVSKSANYCFTNRSNPTGLLLLCEVALGNMYELVHSKFVEKLPNNLHSTKGLGATGPDPGESIVENGIEVPLGKSMKFTGTNSRSLLYNEYIVYDIEQVNIKYMLRVNFQWR